MAIGARDTSSLVMLTGWDATQLQNFRLQDGVTYERIVQEMNIALSALNAEFANDPLWASLVSFTDQPEVEYRIGSSNGFEDFTEYGEADAKRAEVDGHMLPLRAFDRGLGWTWNYLRKARMSQIEADLADAVQDARTKWRVQILTRLLKRGDDSGVTYGLGSSGLSPGFATTAASTGVDFTPPTYAGNTFASTHEHYVGITGGAWTLAAFQDMKAELREHGHQPPYNFMTGPSDEAAVRALTGFVGVAQANVAYANTVSLASVVGEALASGAYPVGVIEDHTVWVVPGMPQYYGFSWKPYGPRSQRNPLRVRLPKGETAPMIKALPDPRAGNNSAYPIQNLMLFVEFGVGVFDRTNGTPRYNNNATWADGTPA